MTIINFACITSHSTLICQYQVIVHQTLLKALTQSLLLVE